MNNFKRWLRQLSTEDIHWFSTIFLSALLATLCSGLVLQWGMEALRGTGMVAHIVSTVLATAVYSSMALFVFYLVYPDEMRLAWDKLRHKQ